MLKKILLPIAMLSISFITGYAIAQSYLTQKEPTMLKNGLASNNQQTPNILSPSDFQDRTQQLQEKKNQALSSQLKDELAKIPPPPPPAIPKTGQTTTPAATLNPTLAPEAAPSGPSPAAPPPPTPAEPQIYTGFQNQDQEQNQSTSPANPPASSGGLNIQY